MDGKQVKIVSQNTSMSQSFQFNSVSLLASQSRTSVQEQTVSLTFKEGHY